MQRHAHLLLLHHIHGLLQGELAESHRDRQADRQHSKQQLQQAAQDADEQLARYQERKVAEMEQIHTKLQTVLDKKNATISQLRESLGCANATLAQHEQDMRKHKLELFESMKW